MGFVRPALAAGAVVVAVTAAVALGFQDDERPQPVRSAASTEAVVPSTTAIPATTAAPPGSPVVGLTPAELKAVVGAAGGAGKSVKATVRTDEVTVPQVDGDPAARSAGRPVTLIRIPGPPVIRDLGVTVALDGVDVGPGLVLPDGSAMVAVVTDPTLARAGAVVTYRYGNGPPTTAGVVPARR